MIYIKIHYGLGNQMFQYAFARCLSIRSNRPFKLDLSFFELADPKEEESRNYNLNKFNIVESIASKTETLKFIKPNFIRRQLNKIFERNFPNYRFVIRESGHSFNNSYFKFCGDTFFIGYWQDERYFKSFEAIIRKEFSFKYLPNDLNKNYLIKIQNCNSINIHVRRGDYLTDKFALANIGLCDLDYYKKAINYLTNYVINPFFFIFSDDPEWCKENLLINNPAHFISHNQSEPYEDLRLMSSCKYHIIANSSFSWWGAWLANFENKIVIAPKNWSLTLGERPLPEKWIVL